MGQRWISVRCGPASVTLGLDGPIVRGVRWRAGAGLLRYWPTEDRGIFLRGGTTRFLAGTGVDYQRPIMAQWDLMASLRYDFHRFTTEEIEARGFSQKPGRSAHSGHRRTSAGPPVSSASAADTAVPGFGAGTAVLRRHRGAEPQQRLRVAAYCVHPIRTADTLSFHWPQSRLPVRIWAEDTLNLPTHVQQGIHQWEAAFLYGEFRAVVVADSNAADVIVTSGIAP